jgi:hypothetical protein
MLTRLRESGVIAVPMLPLKLPGRGYVRPDLRNHRKIVVIDGRIGYSGSQNLVQRNYHRKDNIYYDELVVKIKGPAVLQLGAIFLTDWYSETGNLLDYGKYVNSEEEIKFPGQSIAQILPSGPGYEDENNLKLFTSLIHAAKKKVILFENLFQLVDHIFEEMIKTKEVETSNSKQFLTYFSLYFDSINNEVESGGKRRKRREYDDYHETSNTPSYADYLHRTLKNKYRNKYYNKYRNKYHKTYKKFQDRRKIKDGYQVQVYLKLKKGKPLTEEELKKTGCSKKLYNLKTSFKTVINDLKGKKDDLKGKNDDVKGKKGKKDKTNL